LRDRFLDKSAARSSENAHVRPRRVKERPGVELEWEILPIGLAQSR